MEIMINGQLVTCTPKEYKELIGMGLLPGQPAGTKAASNVADWHEELRQIVEKYPKIDPEPNRYGSIAVTPVYGCVVPAKEAKQTFYEVHLIDKKHMKHGYLSKYAPDSIKTIPPLFAARHPLFTDSITDALIFTSRDAASKFVDEWNDYKSHEQDPVSFREIEIPPNAIMTYRGGDRVEIEDFNMDMHNISITEPVCTRQDADGTIKVYFLKDEQDGLYLQDLQAGTFTSESTKALHFKSETEAKQRMYEYNGSKSHTRQVQVEEKDLPVEHSPEAPKMHMMFACRLVDGSSRYIQDATGECTFTSEPTDAMLFTSLDLADRMAARLNEPSFGNPFEVEAVPVMVL